MDKGMKPGIGKIIGKTVLEVVVTENSNRPNQQIFLVFSDGTELYGSDMQCANHLDSGGAEEAIGYAKRLGATIRHKYP